MRKIISLLLVVVIAFSIVGCSNRGSYSDEAIKSAESVIIYAEKYINGDIDADTAYKSVESVRYKLDVYLDDNKESDYYVKDSSLRTKIFSVEMDLSIESRSGGEIAEIKNEVNELKNEIGY